MHDEDTQFPLDDAIAQLRPTLDAPGQARAGDEALVAELTTKASAAATAPAAGLSLLAKLAIAAGVSGTAVVALVAVEPQGDVAPAPMTATEVAEPALEPPEPTGAVAPAPAPMQEPSNEPDTRHEEDARPPAAPVSASELLRLANEARRDGDTRTAMRRYRRIQQRHPESREAATATIARGKLQLDKLDNPTAAIKSFEAYSSKYPNGSLAPEAAAGIARGWRALGNDARERTAWKDLLVRFPGSVYASEATKRLGVER